MEIIFTKIHEITDQSSDIEKAKRSHKSTLIIILSTALAGQIKLQIIIKTLKMAKLGARGIFAFAKSSLLRSKPPIVILSESRMYKINFKEFSW